MKAINTLKKIYTWLGIPFAPEGTLPNHIHQLCKRIYKFTSIKNFPTKKYKNKSQDSKEGFTIAFWSGIGDSLWAMVLLPAVLHKYHVDRVNLIVHSEKISVRNNRSNAYLERFSFFSSVRSENFPIMKNPVIDDEGYPCYVESGEKQNSIFNYLLLANTYLEHGKNFNDIAEALSLDRKYLNYFPFKDYVWKFEDFNEVKRILRVSKNGYCVFYMCSLTDNTVAGLNRGGLWKINDWLMLGKKIYEKTGNKIVIVGASYDIDYITKLQKDAYDNFHDIFINNCGTLDLTETLGLLKYANFVIGLPSGIPISSTFLRTKTAMFWRPQHLSMHDLHEKYGFHKDFSIDWVPKDMLENNNYLAFWYGKDNYETVYKKIESENWFDTKVKYDMNEILFQQNIREVNIEISNYCNRRCPYCPNSIFEYNDYKNIDFTVFKKVILELSEIGYENNIALNLFNEPLYETGHTFSLIETIKKYLPKSKILIFTNGDFINKEVIDNLSNNVHAIAITIHYNKIFSTDDSYKKIIKILRDIGENDVKVNKEPNRVYSEFTRKKSIISIQSKNFKIFGQDRGGSVTQFTNSCKRTNPCNISEWQFNINFEGDVYPCCNIYPRDINKSLLLGNVKQNTIFDIYGSEAYQNFIKNISNCKFPKQCMNCTEER